MPLNQKKTTKGVRKKSPTTKYQKTFKKLIKQKITSKTSKKSTPKKTKIENEKSEDNKRDGLNSEDDKDDTHFDNADDQHADDYGKSEDEDEADAKFTTEENRVTNEFIGKHIKLKCELCEAETETFLELKHHFTKVHKVQGYIRCCNKMLSKRQLLIDHIKLHLNPNFFA